MKTEERTVAVTASPESYDAENSVYYNSASTGITNGYNGSDNSASYAQIYFTRGSQAETFFYYQFGLSIPETATINSVACSVRVRCNTTNTTYVTARQVQLFSGTATAKGAAQTIGGSTTLSNVTYQLTTGSWTAAELNDARIRLYAKRGTTNTTTGYYVRFYGATLTVNYTYNQVVYEVAAVSNVSGVLMSPSRADIDAGGSRTFEVIGALTNVIVTDNLADVTSQLVPQSGGSVSATYTLSNVSEDHLIVFDLAGNKVFVKVNGSWEQADDVKVKENGTWQSFINAYKRENGTWIEQDKSAMFDPDGLYLKG